MKCEKCGKNDAAIYYKEIINGQTREMHICPDCAKEMRLGGEFENAFAGIAKDFGSFSSFFGEPFSPLLGGSFGSLWNDMTALPASTRSTQAEKKCPTCGMTESELRRTGRAGCPDCYHVFEDILNPYIRQVHGAESHLGAKPHTTEIKEHQTDAVAKLRAAQQEAIASENYEEAARLRDEIRRLEEEGK